ncbi:MAG: Flp family type IVb pilin [Actinobacteria bacterium]|nr:Flp family type IVb pilin [Actinomycetota bacterium]
MDDEGGVAAEYGVLLAGIVAVVAVAAAALGGRISDLFDTILP